MSKPKHPTPRRIYQDKKQGIRDQILIYQLTHPVIKEPVKDKFDLLFDFLHETTKHLPSENQEQAILAVGLLGFVRAYNSLGEGSRSRVEEENNARYGYGY